MGRRGPRWAFLSTAGKKGKGVSFSRERDGTERVSPFLSPSFFYFTLVDMTRTSVSRPLPAQGKNRVSHLCPHIARFPTNYIPAGDGGTTNRKGRGAKQDQDINISKGHLPRNT